MTITLRGAKIWDGSAAESTDRPGEIRIDGDRITSVETLHPPSRNVLGRPEGPDSQSIFDLRGHFVMPGLVDGHIHLCLDPTLMTPKDQEGVSPADRDVAMRDRARSMVESGITTARDLGGGDWRVLALRDEIAAGNSLGPRLLCAGQPVTRPEGHCHFWGGGAANTLEQRRVIERQVEHGVDLIKVMATGGVFTKGSDAKATQFSREEMIDLVAHAERFGRRVAAHCHGTAGIEHAVGGGVRTVEHCSFAGPGGFGTDVDPALIAEMGKADVWVSPTVNLGWGRRITNDSGQPSDFFKRMSGLLHRLKEAGIPMLASTDAGIPGVAHHRLAEGLLAFQRYAGLTPAELLRTATSEAARALELDREIGRVAAGHCADLIVVRRDPTVDPTTLLDPVMVIARGRVAKNELPNPQGRPS